MGAARGQAEDEQFPDGSPARLAPESSGSSRAQPHYMNSIGAKPGLARERPVCGAAADGRNAEPTLRRSDAPRKGCTARDGSGAYGDPAARAVQSVGLSAPRPEPKAAGDSCSSSAPSARPGTPRGQALRRAGAKTLSPWRLLMTASMSRTTISWSSRGS